MTDEKHFPGGEEEFREGLKVLCRELGFKLNLSQYEVDPALASLLSEGSFYGLREIAGNFRYNRRRITANLENIANQLVCYDPAVDLF